MLRSIRSRSLFLWLSLHQQGGFLVHKRDVLLFLLFSSLLPGEHSIIALDNSCLQSCRPVIKELLYLLGVNQLHRKRIHTWRPPHRIRSSCQQGTNHWDGGGRSLQRIMQWRIAPKVHGIHIHLYGTLFTLCASATPIQEEADELRVITSRGR